MSRPLVSIIMPTFNHASFIGDAIDSVLNQTYNHFELIIIDNYSTDSTEKIIRSFSDQRIKYYRFSNNGIIAASRNCGIKNARGEFIAFLDSDDLWYENKLARQVEAMAREPDAALCFCPFKMDSDDQEYNNEIRTARDQNFSGHIYDRFLNCNFMAASSVLIRAVVLKLTGDFDVASNLVGAEDFDLWLRISRDNKICYVPEVQGTYRLHAANYGGSVDRIEKPINVINKHFSLGWVDKRKAGCAKANFYFREGWVFINKDAVLARTYFLKTLNVNTGNVRIILASLIGLFFREVPASHLSIGKGHWDKRIGKLFFNAQSL